MFETRRFCALAVFTLLVAPQVVLAGHYTVRYRYTVPHYYAPWTPVLVAPTVVPHAAVVPQAAIVTQSAVVPQFATVTSLQFAAVPGVAAPAPDNQAGPVAQAGPAEILARRGRSGTPAAPVAGAGAGGPATGAPGTANPACNCDTETTFDRHMAATKSLLCQLEERYANAGLTKGSCTASRGTVAGAAPGGTPAPGSPAIVDFRTALRAEIAREIRLGVLDAEDFAAAGTRIRGISPDQIQNLRARGQKLAAITRLILSQVQPTSLDKIERWTSFADKVLELLAGQPQLQSLPVAPAGGAAPDRFHEVITDDIGRTLNPN